MNDNLHRLYDPKLKKAMKEIESILSKHDIMGNIYLASSTHSENRFFPSPKWSILINEKDELGRIIGLRIRSKKENYPDKIHQLEAINKTVSALLHMLDWQKREHRYFTAFIEILSEKFKIVHVPDKGYIAHRDVMDEEALPMDYKDDERIF